MNEDRIVQYRELAITYGEGLLAGDSDKANAAHAEMRELSDLLAANDRLGELYALYSDANVSVQLCAATDTIDLDRTRSIKKLQEIKDSVSSIIGLVASVVIKDKCETSGDDGGAGRINR